MIFLIGTNAVFNRFYFGFLCKFVASKYFKQNILVLDERDMWRPKFNWNKGRGMRQLQTQLITDRTVKIIANLTFIQFKKH